MNVKSVIAKIVALSIGLLTVTSNIQANISQAASVNPSMTAKDYFSGDDKSKLKNLEIKRLDISVSLNNAYAETHILVDFYNPTDKQLEGDFILDMPYGSIVTGYGLDIDGRMVEGVIVEKEAAKKVFEDRIRAGVDPGLAEVTRENAFKTRVFPINKNQTRSISLSFVSPISESRSYVLPLVSDEAVDNFTLSVSNNFLDQAPGVQLPDDLSFIWESKNKNNGKIINSVSANDIVLTGELRITPQKLRTHSIERHSNGQAFLAVNLAVNTLTKKTSKTPKTVRVYWDSSLSHLGTAEEELEFIDQALASFKDAAIEVIRFSDSTVPISEPGKNLKNISKVLQNIVYHGATDLEALFESQVDRSKVDLCLLVSDGRHTLGKFPLQTLPCALYTVSAAVDSDRGGLGLLAKYGGGQFIDLNAVSHSEGMNILSANTPRLLGLKLNGRNKISEAEWNIDGDLFRLIVPVDDKHSKLGLVFDRSKFATDFSVDNIQEGNSHPAFWAKQTIDTQRAKGTDRTELVALSQTYSLAANETSFLVLETVEDYVRNAISLPLEGYDEAQHAEYAELMREKEEVERAIKDQRLENVVAQWQERIAWHETDFDYKPKKVRHKIVQALVDSVSGIMGRSEEAVVEEESMADSAAQSEQMFGFSAGFSAADAKVEEVVVTAARLARSNDKNDAGSIEIQAWTPDRVYLKAVKGLCSDAFMQAYFTQREEHGNLPGFYLEMADAQARCDDTSGAANIALSALELPSANQDTITAVAQRLMSLKSYATALELFRQVTVLEPNSPQSWRNLALALEQQADFESLNKRERLALYEESLTLLNYIIENPWEANYAGIEMISVMEANLIIEKIQAMGAKNTLLDKRLRRLLDVDLRVLLSWNIDRVDVDLWVDEPSNERVYYSNQLSAIGGRISNDMTNGYGPEEYLLKQAISGDYEIKVHYFSSDIINPNGAVIVRAYIFRNWGRDNQSVELADLEFTDQKEKEYRVATVTIN